MAQRKEQRWVIQRYLENMQILSHSPCLNLKDVLRIRRVMETERQKYRDFDSEHVHSRDITCVIETSVAPKKNLHASTEYRNALQEIDSVFHALLLYRDRLIKWKVNSESLGELANLNGTERYADQSARPLWRNFVSSHHQRPFELDTNDTADLKKCWEKLNRLWINPPYLQTSTVRFGMASQMAGIPARRQYRFVDYVTSMEALLTNNEPELSFKLPLRMASLLGRSSKEKQDIFDFMREAYGVRSDLVHGDNVSKVLTLNVREVKIGFEEAIGRLHSYSRNCIQFAIDLLEAGFRKKDQLTRLLDLSTLRSDLRDLMLSFLGGGQNGEALFNKCLEASKEPFNETLSNERCKLSQRDKILSLKSSEAKCLGIGKSTLHYLRKGARSQRAFRVNHKVLTKLEPPAIPRPAK